MKQVKINSLLDLPQDGVQFQREWALRGQHGKRALLLLVALFAGNIGPGLYMISCLNRFDLGMLVAFFIVLIGYALPHLLFLGRIERFWRSILKPQNSWISRGFIVATLFLFFAFLSIARCLPIVNADYLNGNSSVYNIILKTGFILAFLLSLYPAFLFSCVRAIPFWNSVILAPLFVVQSFGSGIALAFVLSHLPGVSSSGIDELLPVEAILITLTAGLIGAYLYGRYKEGRAGKLSVEQLVRGKYRRIFLFGALSCEIIIPLTIVLMTFLGMTSVLLIAGELIQLSGIWCFKYCLLNAGAYNQLYSICLYRT